MKLKIFKNNKVKEGVPGNDYYGTFT